MTQLLLVPAVNRFVNGDFAADTSGWSSFGGTVLARTTADSKFETASGQVTIAASKGNGSDGVYSLPSIPAQDGQTWTLGYWVKGTAGSEVASYIYGDTLVVISDDFNRATLGANWTLNPLYTPALQGNQFSSDPLDPAPGYGYAYWTASYVTGDVEVSVDCPVISGLNGGFEMVLERSTDFIGDSALTGYSFSFSADPGGGPLIFRRANVGGAYVLVGIAFGNDLVAGDRYIGRIVGNRIQTWRQRGSAYTLLLEYVDPAPWTGPWRGGIGTFDYTMRLDNFHVGSAAVVTTLTGDWQQVAATTTLSRVGLAAAGFAIDSRTSGAQAFKVDGVQFDGASPPLLLAPSSNRFLNDDFAVDTSGWSTFGTAVLTRTTTDSKYGSASGQVTIAASTGAGNDGIYSAYPYVPAATGQTWTLDFWAKGPVGTTIGAYIYRDNFDAFFAFITVALTGDWQEVTLTTGPLTNVSFAAGFAIDSRTVGAVAFKVDGVTFSSSQPALISSANGGTYPNPLLYPSSSTFPSSPYLSLTPA